MKPLPVRYILWYNRIIMKGRGFIMKKFKRIMGIAVCIYLVRILVDGILLAYIGKDSAMIVSEWLQHIL